MGGGPNEGFLVFGDTGRALTGRQGGPSSAGFWVAFLECLRICGERGQMWGAPAISRIDVREPGTLRGRNPLIAVWVDARSREEPISLSRRLLATAVCIGTTE